MRVSFLLLFLSVLYPISINGADTFFRQRRLGYGGNKRLQSRNFIVQCCSYKSCILPVGGALRTTSNTPNIKVTALSTVGVNSPALDTEETDPQADVTEDIQTTKIVGVATIKDTTTVALNKNMNTIIDSSVVSKTAPTTILSSAVTSISNNGATSLEISSTTSTSFTTNPPTNASTTQATPISATIITTNALTTITSSPPISTTHISTTPILITSTSTISKTTSQLITTTTTLSPLCVQPCPASCDCNGEALVLDAQGEISSETITGNFILKCGKQVNTTAYYHSKPNVTNFNNTEMVCCSVCSIPVSKSTSSRKKRAVASECLTDFQNVYLENVNGLVKVEFSVAGERGDCAFLAGSNITITWKPITLCSPGVKFFGSNNTACSVVNSWQSCGNQIQNKKLPADPYCQLLGPATCGQTANYQCTASNNVTVFQSLTQGLLLERVSNWAYFWLKNSADWKTYADAFAYCENHMMDLAVFDTMTELDAVLQWYQAGATQMYGSSRTHAFIGIDHIAVTFSFVVTKTRAPASVFKWVVGEPSANGEQCVALIANYPSAGQNGMEDLNCNIASTVICKVRPEFVWTVNIP